MKTLLISSQFSLYFKQREISFKKFNGKNQLCVNFDPISQGSPHYKQGKVISQKNVAYNGTVLVMIWLVMVLLMVLLMDVWILFNFI